MPRDHKMGHCGKLSLLAMLLFFNGCRTTDSSDLSQEPVAPSQDRLAGHRLLKWYKADNSSVTVRFPHAIFQDGSGRYWVGNGIVWLRTTKGKTRGPTLVWRLSDGESVTYNRLHKVVTVGYGSDPRPFFRTTFAFLMEQGGARCRESLSPV
jgi:hypothetical protein